MHVSGTANTDSPPTTGIDLGFMHGSYLTLGNYVGT